MGVRLLIVDDEQELRHTLAAQLDCPDFEVHAASTAEQAVAMVRQQAFDVVLLDVLMPGLDGLGALKQIKRLRPSTEVILLTGHASIRSAMDGLGKGAFDYVIKPCPRSNLLGKIESACEIRR